MHWYPGRHGVGEKICSKRELDMFTSLASLVIELFDILLMEFGMFDIEVFNCLGIFDMAVFDWSGIFDKVVFDCSGIFDKVVFDCLGRSEVELFENRSVFSNLVDLVSSSNSDLVFVPSDFELVEMILVDPFSSFDSTSKKLSL